MIFSSSFHLVGTKRLRICYSKRESNESIYVFSRQLFEIKLQTINCLEIWKRDGNQRQKQKSIYLTTHTNIYWSDNYHVQPYIIRSHSFLYFFCFQLLLFTHIFHCWCNKCICNQQQSTNYFTMRVACAFVQLLAE